MHAANIAPAITSASCIPRRRSLFESSQASQADAAKEDKAGWSAFLKHLMERGLKGVELITSDAWMGLSESAAEFEVS